MKPYKKYRTYQWLRNRNQQRGKIIMFISALLLLLFLSKLSLAQDSLPGKTLSADQVLEIVKKFHPVAKQADIFVEKAKADVTIARGGFDPSIKNESAQKTFDGTDYYYYNRPELTIPTWFGVEISGGTEFLSGNRTDPVETKGETNFIGVSIPLAKNLLMDKRRAALQTAKIFRDASAAERRNILNNLLLDAMKTYWSWVFYYQQYKILSEAVIVNEQRVAFVTTAFRLGDRPAIDTTEAIAQLQSFELLKTKAWLDFQNTGLELSVFLWTTNSTPYYLPADVIPEKSGFIPDVAEAVVPELTSLLEAAKKNHPELLIYDYKLDVLAVEKKLKFQELLPAINFSYNQLGKGYDLLKTTRAPLFENNFRYGLSLGIPLRLSEGRGEFRKAKLKIAETRLQFNQKQGQIEAKIRSYFNELVALKTQVSIQEKAYKNYLALQKGEEIRFQSGESSLFLINARETKTLEALQKLQELKASYFKTENMLKWAAGILGS